MSLTPPAPSQVLYVLDLAQRLQRLELSGAGIDAAAYKLFARRLREGLAGCSVAELPSPRHQPAALREALSDRHFAEHGYFAGHASAARHVKRVLERVQSRLRG